MTSEVKVSPDPAGDDAGLIDKTKGQADTYKDLSPAQVKLRTNKKFKTLVAVTTMAAVFVDILGTALVMPVLPALCSYAPGGPYETIMAQPAPLEVREALVKELINPDAFKDPKPPFKFSLAMNAVMSFGQLGSALGSLVFGQLCDRIGCKIPMQICIFNGIAGYFMIYAGGKWVGNYWLFALGMFWNNFFGNTMGVGVVLMRRLYEEGPERDAMVGGCMGLGLIGGSVGALIVMPFVTNPKNGENFFGAIWLAIGLTCVTFLAVTCILVPEPPKSEAEEKKEEEARNEPTPALAKKILIIAVLASALDSGGDEGTRMARGTIMSAVFPEWSTTERQNYLILALIFVIIFAMIGLSMLRKCMNLASICVFGCFCTLGTQCALMVEWKAAPYIVIWHFGKFFGFMSTIGVGFIVMETAPPANLGTWNSRNEALTNLMAGICPLIFAPVYDAMKNKRGQEMLAITATISFLATVFYVPLVGMLPKAKKEKTGAEKEEEQKSDAQYLALSDLEFMRLPLEVVDRLSAAAMEKGEPPRIISWGRYAEQREGLDGVGERAVKDFEYLNNNMIAMLTSRELMMKEQENFAKYQEMLPKFDRDQAKQEMGTWIADYFDDAGYENWETQTTIYKAMLLNAFPPIDALDDIKPDWATMPLEKWEENLMKFLETMDSHIGQSKRRMRNGQSAGSVTALIRRR